MMEGKADALDPARILDDPANFLHSIDVESDQAIFFRTNPQLLRAASFVDGRSRIATTQPGPTPLAEVIDAARPAPIADRFLFNSSFCGSTLLARLIDVPGRSLVLKEPKCLADLAAWKTLKIRAGRSIDRLGPSLKLARLALRRPFVPGEAVTVKPSSWANGLLDTLTEDAARIRPIFITISRVDFLRAVFRGGAERMNYAARLAWHMATDVEDGDELLREATEASPDPLRQAANLAILARYLQVGSFQRAAKAGSWNDNHVIDYQTIVQQPHEAAVKAACALDLNIDHDDIESNVAQFAGLNSKQPEAAFSIDRRRSVDRQLDFEHRQLFGDALAWAEAALGPQRSVIP